MEADISAVRARIEVVGHRLAALAERGSDTAALHSQLVHASDLLEGGAVEEARSLADEIAASAKRVAAGETRASGELKGVLREHLVGELREALDGGVAEAALAQAMESMRREMEERMQTFERRLRDQFARELAQLISARPWMKDILAQGQDASGSRAASGTSQAARDRGFAEVTASQRDLSAKLADIAGRHATLAERLAAIEQRANAAGVMAPMTRVTDLHVDVGAAGDSHDTVHAPSLVEDEIGQSWPFGEESRSNQPSLTQTAIEKIVAASTSSLPAPSDSHAAHSLPALQGKANQALETAMPTLTPQPMGVPATSAVRPSIDEGHIRRLIEDRLAQWKAPAGEGLVADDDEILAQLIRILPQALEDNSVRTALFATIALEAIEKPGALAHLSGLRDFLKAELGLVSSA